MSLPSYENRFRGSKTTTTFPWCWWETSQTSKKTARSHGPRHSRYHKTGEVFHTTKPVQDAEQMLTKSSSICVDRSSSRTSATTARPKLIMAHVDQDVAILAVAVTAGVGSIARYYETKFHEQHITRSRRPCALRDRAPVFVLHSPLRYPTSGIERYLDAIAHRRINIFSHQITTLCADSPASRVELACMWRWLRQGSGAQSFSLHVAQLGTELVWLNATASTSPDAA
jgi:hypothetical protein